jgi:uncharacterized DUF497 family protein
MTSHKRQIVTTIKSIKIVYDENKNERNIGERNLSFEAVAQFDFDNALIKLDDRKHYPELRYIALGQLNARLHVLCFTPFNEGIRVISFRKANAREINHYEQNKTTD